MIAPCVIYSNSGLQLGILKDLLDMFPHNIFGEAYSFFV